MMVVGRGVGYRQQSKMWVYAFSLASSEREDADAVEELRRAAGRLRGRQRLAEAAKNLSTSRFKDETELGDRVYRLLHAAASEAAVEPLTPERAEFFRGMRTLQGDREEVWERMTQAIPALRDLEADVTAAAATRPDDHDEAVRVWRVLLDRRLRPLVGPQAESLGDPVLRTAIAYRFAARYLTRTYGLSDHDAGCEEDPIPGLPTSRADPPPDRDVCWLALKLGFRGREDREAVEELRRAAGGSRQQLIEAADELTTRSGFLKDETEFGDRADRLLRAAVSDGATIEPVTPERAEFFRRVRTLEENPGAAWERMIQTQPALRDLEPDITAGGSLPDNHGEAVLAWRVLLSERLAPLIGPDAETLADPLLRTNTAYRIAASRLTRAYGLPERYTPSQADPVELVQRVRRSRWMKQSDL